MSPPPVVVIDGLTKRYGAATALDGVDLALRPGITALLGPNGAGKTTLNRILATTESPSGGTVRVLGHDPAGTLADRTAIRRELGYLPQEVEFPRGMTAFSFVDYVAVLKEWTDAGARRAEVRRVLDLVGLGDRATARVRTLSGGQRRRLGLAQALIGDPALLILDEPTTGLDPEQRAGLRAVLSARAGRGLVLLATHQTEDVAALCDHVVVIAGGRVVFDGPVAAFVATAEGRVWLDDSPAADARMSWRTGTGRIRSVGGRPGPGAEAAEPTVEDAYLLTLGGTAAGPLEEAA